MSKDRIKFACSFFVFLLCLILIGCAGGSFSNIQNIRQIENIDEIKDGGALKAMTFNIHVGGGPENPKAHPRRIIATEENLIKVADAIKSEDLDIVGLQEVRGYDQAKFLAEKLNLNFAYSVHGRSNWYGLAILSKFRIIDIRIELINWDPYDRIALISKIDINGKMINVLNVHYALLNYNGQVSETMKIINSSENPVILMGDLNRKPYYPEISPIRTKLIATCEAIESWSGRCESTGHGKIDYIFVDPNYFEVLDAGLVLRKHREASDHIAYWARLKFKD